MLTLKTLNHFSMKSNVVNVYDNDSRTIIQVNVIAVLSYWKRGIPR